MKMVPFKYHLIHTADNSFLGAKQLLISESFDQKIDEILTYKVLKVLNNDVAPKYHSQNYFIPCKLHFMISA